MVYFTDSSLGDKLTSVENISCLASAFQDNQNQVSHQQEKNQFFGKDFQKCRRKRFQIHLRECWMCEFLDLVKSFLA